MEFTEAIVINGLSDDETTMIAGVSKTDEGLSVLTFRMDTGYMFATLDTDGQILAKLPGSLDEVKNFADSSISDYEVVFGIKKDDSVGIAAIDSAGTIVYNNTDADIAVIDYISLEDSDDILNNAEEVDGIIDAMNFHCMDMLDE